MVIKTVDNRKPISRPNGINEKILFVLKPNIGKIILAFFIPILLRLIYGLIKNLPYEIPNFYDYLIIVIFYYPFACAIFILANHFIGKNKGILHKDTTLLKIVIAFLLIFNPLGLTIIYIFFRGNEFFAIVVILLIYAIYRKSQRRE